VAGTIDSTVPSWRRSCRQGRLTRRSTARSCMILETCPCHPCLAIQPEDALALRLFCPSNYFLAESNSGFGMASRVVLDGVRIEGGIFGNREFGENQRLADIKDLCPADCVNSAEFKRRCNTDFQGQARGGTSRRMSLMCPK